jgi:hypothetical protein
VTCSARPAGLCGRVGQRGSASRASVPRCPRLAGATGAAGRETLSKTAGLRIGPATARCACPAFMRTRDSGPTDPTTHGRPQRRVSQVARNATLAKVGSRPSLLRWCLPIRGDARLPLSDTSRLRAERSDGRLGGKAAVARRRARRLLVGGCDRPPKRRWRLSGATPTSPKQSPVQWGHRDERNRAPAGIGRPALGGAGRGRPGAMAIAPAGRAGVRRPCMDRCWWSSVSQRPNRRAVLFSPGRYQCPCRQWGLA